MSKGLLLYAPADQQQSVRFVKGVGEKGAKRLRESKFEITSVQHLLQHYPRRHLDFSDTKRITEVRAGDEVTIIAEVAKVSRPPPKRPRVPVKVTLFDGTSHIELAFFNQPWRVKQLAVGTTIAAKGKISLFRGHRQMTSPMVDVIRDAGEAVKIVPIYPATADIHTAWLRRIIRAALDMCSPLADPLPSDVIKRHGLLERTKAMADYHFPQEMADKWVARKRLVFDELFTLQVGLAYRKRRVSYEATGIQHRLDAELPNKFLEALPFELTAAQTRASKELASDLASKQPMNRILQGDVGSGKTVVALYGALIAASNGYQAAVMAPTEVLAQQHYLTMTKLLEPLTSSSGSGQMGLFGGPRVVLLTGSTPAAQRRAALANIADGSASIVVGTHALIQEAVEFSNLSFVVIDEQHRFGVHQRVALREQGPGDATVDVLIMTATPIPRTLALTLYGDLEVSVLDEMPAGRRPIETKVVQESDRKSAYDLLREQVKAGHQAYVITPLIDDSDKLEVKAATAEAKRLAEEVFPDLRVALMHGKLPARKKEAVMTDFRSGETDVLISTTVVEVGVDVPNATVMVIEDADRFGLSQLHQLRGRIGRSEFPSFCLLFASTLEGAAEDERAVAQERLSAVASTTDGFELANKDLELRGPGAIMGVRQAGWSDLKLTNLISDIDLLRKARDEAFELIAGDPSLKGNPLIRSEMEGRFADRLDWLFHS